MITMIKWVVFFTANCKVNHAIDWKDRAGNLVKL